MYFLDLSPYTYFPANDPDLLNVGWLDAKNPFPVSKATDQFLADLFSYCASPVQRTRGFHACPFCSRPHRWGTREELAGNTILIGSGEIRVNGKNGIVFAAPDLIYHYVRRHNYDPPDEFKAAVQNSSAAQ